jgi:hypothetical protein
MLGQKTHRMQKKWQCKRVVPTLAVGRVLTAVVA